MKILLIGCVESSYRFLKRLIDIDANVVGVITKHESSFNSDFYDLIPICEESGISYKTVKNINDPDSVDYIRSLNPDIGFCFGWSQLVRGEVINLFPMGMVGFHPAKLPMNRGRHPLIWALVLGLSETASSFFMITEGADEGDIISQEKIIINYEDDARTLYDKVMEVAVLQEEIIVRAFENGTLVAIPQDLNKSNSWRKRGKTDGEIDWRMTSRSIYNLVRALTKPYVGAHFVYKGCDCKVWKVKEIDTSAYENIEPGKVLARNEDGTIDVKCGNGIIRLLDFDAIDISEGDYIL